MAVRCKEMAERLKSPSACISARYLDDLCGRLGAAIPQPKRVSPPVTEVGSSGLTKLLISRENELALRGSPRGGPSEGRASNQRDQRESSDKCLHDTSLCWTIGLHLPTGACSRLLPSLLEYRLHCGVPSGWQPG
jgi:hypothetical protein